MNYDEFKNLVDRLFLEEWIASIGNSLDTIPDTKDGRTLASFMCQLSVLATLQQRGLIQKKELEKSGQEDFAMELVAKLWPIFPIGFKHDLGEELWKRVQYVPWDTSDSVHHNLHVPAGRDIARDLMYDRFKEFPLLSVHDIDAIIVQTRSFGSLVPFFSDIERQIIASLPFDTVMLFQRQVMKRQLGGEIQQEITGLSEVDLFKDVKGKTFELLRQNASQILALILAHRHKFNKPPQASHRKMVESILVEGDMNKSLMSIPVMSGDKSLADLHNCFWKLTFIISYEASFKLLLSDSFLDLASGRDEKSRNEGGFHFWYDLVTPYCKEISKLYLEWLEGFIMEILPEWSENQRAAFIGSSPICLFLEALRLGQLPDSKIEIIGDVRTDESIEPEPAKDKKPAKTDSIVQSKPVSNIYQTEHTIRVFISSTFRDMQEERNELVKKVFPQLRKLCSERGLGWAEIDLRWGITEEQAEHGDVLPICLREIERCRPFFIGLLGERYGWIPLHIPDELVTSFSSIKQCKGNSLTEMEIVHGALNSPEMANLSYFYFRDRGYLEKLPSEKRHDFVENDTNRQEKLLRLKHRIRNSGLKVRENYMSPEELGQMVLNDLTDAINREFPSKNLPDLYQRMSEEHEAFARSRRNVYIGRQEYIQRLDQHADEIEQPLVILGNSGSGKSSLLANWAFGYRKLHPDSLIFMHFVGSGSETAGWEGIVRRIMNELKQYANIEDDIPQDSKELCAVFSRWLISASFKLPSPDARIILILDGLNQLEDREGALDLVWLPVEFPKQIVVVLSTLPGRSLDEINRRKLPTMIVEPLNIQERHQLITEYLKHFSKQLNSSNIEHIASSPQASNPLFVRALLDELRIFGIHEKLEERIDYYLKAELVEDLFDRILARCEDDFSKDQPYLVKDTMSLIWASRHGLTEAEILDILGQNDDPFPRALWSPLFLSVESSLIIRSGLITFSHDYMRKAVGNRYLMDDQQRLIMHKRIADYFDARDVDMRLLDELPWQLSKAADWDRLIKRLKIPSFFRSVYKHDGFSLKTYWKDIEDNSAYRMENVYAEVIERPDEHPEIIDVLSRLMLEKGRLEIALKLFNAEVTRFERSGDQYDLASSLQNAALALSRLGQMEQSTQVLRRAEVIWRQSGYIRGLQSTLGSIASNLRELGQLDEAKKLMLEEEKLARELNNRPVLAINLNNQALLCKDQGDFDGAIEKFRQSELLYKELGDQDGLQTIFGNQASLYLMNGNNDAALELLKKQEKICRESASLLGLMTSLCNQAIILRHKGEIDASWKVLQEHEQLCLETGFQKGLVLNLVNKAHILKIWRKFDEALESYREAEQVSRRIGNLHGVEVALSNQAAVLEDKMDLEAALQLRKEQEKICRELGMPNELAICLTRYAEILGIPLGRPKEAKPMIEEAEQLARELGIDSLLKEIDQVKRQIYLALLF